MNMTLKRNKKCTHKEKKDYKRLFKYRWFHGHLSSQEAEKLILEQGENGSFLVRESQSRKGDFILCVRSGDNVDQILIPHKNKFYEAGSSKFKSLAEVVELYRKNLMLKTSGTFIYLNQTINATKFSVSGIHCRVKQLLKKNASKSGFSEEFESLRRWQHEFKHLRFTRSKNKDRYADIVPYAHTRVKLMDVDPKIPGSDYINANYIKWDKTYGGNEIPSDPNGKTYIATQGCLSTTVTDFWNMVWQENCLVIVMITKEMERGKIKCARYWPEKDKPQDYGTMTIKNLVKCTSAHQTIRKLLVKNNTTGVERKVYQYHFQAWPDHGVPSDPGCVLNFLHEVNKRQEFLIKALPVDDRPGAILVHCSAGIGRTGTYIVIDMILDQINKNGLDSNIDIQRTIQMVRSQRYGMVQNEGQYKLIYLAVEQHVRTITKQMKAVEKSLIQSGWKYTSMQ